MNDAKSERDPPYLESNGLEVGYGDGREVFQPVLGLLELGNLGFGDVLEEEIKILDFEIPDSMIERDATK